MQHLAVSEAVRPLKWSLGVKWLNRYSGGGGGLKKEDVEGCI